MTMGSDIKIGDGSKKTFRTLMATWCEDTSHNLKKGGGGTMMKRAGDLKVGIHQIGDVLDTV